MFQTLVAGAGGFEPATHGFGVAMGQFSTSRILAFSEICEHLGSTFEKVKIN